MSSDDKKRGRPRSADRHKKKTTNLRLHPLVRQQLDALVERNASTLTGEIVIAIRQHLTANGLWPVARPPKKAND